MRHRRGQNIGKTADISDAEAVSEGGAPRRRPARRLALPSFMAML
jgi:hypothetical protein